MNIILIFLRLGSIVDVHLQRGQHHKTTRKNHYRMDAIRVFHSANDHWQLCRTRVRTAFTEKRQKAIVRNARKWTVLFLHRATFSSTINRRNCINCLWWKLYERWKRCCYMDRCNHLRRLTGRHKFVGSADLHSTSFSSQKQYITNERTEAEIEGNMSIRIESECWTKYNAHLSAFVNEKDVCLDFVGTNRALFYGNILFGMRVKDNCLRFHFAQRIVSTIGMEYHGFYRCCLRVCLSEANRYSYSFLEL